MDQDTSPKSYLSPITSVLKNGGPAIENIYSSNRIRIWEYRPYKLLWKQGQVGLQGWVVDPGSIYGHKNNKYFSNSDILFLDCIGWQKKTWINQSQAILHLATCCWFSVLVRYFLKGGLWWGGRVWSTIDWTFIDLSM